MKEAYVLPWEEEKHKKEPEDLVFLPVHWQICCVITDKSLLSLGL